MGVPPTTTKANNGKAATVLTTVVAVAAAYLIVERLEALAGDRDTTVLTVALAGSIAGLVLLGVLIIVGATRGSRSSPAKPPPRAGHVISFA